MDDALYVFFAVPGFFGYFPNGIIVAEALSLKPILKALKGV